MQWILYLLYRARKSRISPNLKSPHDNPQVLQDYLDKEVKFGKVGGPFDNPSFSNMECHAIRYSHLGEGFMKQCFQLFFN